MNASLVSAKVIVLEDSLATFNGEPLYRKDETYYGVLDTHSSIGLVAFRFGNQFVNVEDSNDLRFVIIDSFRFSSNVELKSIESYLKSISLNKWIKENVKDKFKFYLVSPTTSRHFRNNVTGNGGGEYIDAGHPIFAVKNLNVYNPDLMVQVRKGSIFYIKDDHKLTTVKELSIESMDYELLKEAKFIIENDYKYGGVSHVQEPGVI